MTLSCPDVHLIGANDLSSSTVCLTLLICELAFTYVCIASCNLSAYTSVMCKVKATYLLTYLLAQHAAFRAAIVERVGPGAEFAGKHTKR